MLMQSSFGHPKRCLAHQCAAAMLVNGRRHLWYPVCGLLNRLLLVPLRVPLWDPLGMVLSLTTRDSDAKLIVRWMALSLQTRLETRP
jgi:hypothetical protein